MSKIEGTIDFNSSESPAADASFNNFEMTKFGQELNFQSFDNTQPSGSSSYFEATIAHSQVAGLRGIYNSTAYQDLTGAEFADGEPPLLEELGIHPKRIFQKSLAVINPLRASDRQQLLQDPDMAGPLLFCLTLAGFLLLRGKVIFSSIYGMALLGCIFIYCLLSLMVIRTQVSFLAVASVLGYCLLPMVVLSGINVFVTLQGPVGLMVTIISIFWCATSASKMFATAFAINHQRLLIAYPCAVLYGGFALITIY